MILSSTFWWTVRRWGLDDKLRCCLSDGNDTLIMLFNVTQNVLLGDRSLHGCKFHPHLSLRMFFWGYELFKSPHVVHMRFIHAIDQWFPATGPLVSFNVNIALLSTIHSGTLPWFTQVYRFSGYWPWSESNLSGSGVSKFGILFTCSITSSLTAIFSCLATPFNLFQVLLTSQCFHCTNPVFPRSYSIMLCLFGVKGESSTAL